MAAHVAFPMIFVYLHETAKFRKSSQMHLNYTEKKDTKNTRRTQYSFTK